MDEVTKLRAALRRIAFWVPTVAYEQADQRYVNLEEVYALNKFTVVRNDGQSELGQKHFGCASFSKEYFMKHTINLDDYAILVSIGYTGPGKQQEYWQTYGGHGHVQDITGLPINTFGRRHGDNYK